MPMRIRHAAFMLLPIAAFAFAVNLPPAQAGPLVDPFGRPAYRLNEKDLDLLKQAVREVLEKHQVGATAEWSDPDTGKAGQAKLLDVFTRDGMPCGQVEHVFTKGEGRSYQLPFCKMADGRWKIAF
jgi:surface antigen